MQQMQQLQALTLSQKLVQKVSHAIITPKAVCPECGQVLKEDEIMAGWRNDPVDLTTQCPNSDCRHRFVAELQIALGESGLEIFMFLCRDQLYYELENLQRGPTKQLGINFLHDNHPQVLWNLIKHHGTYDLGLKAFRKYQNEHSQD